MFDYSPRIRTLLMTTQGNLEEYKQISKILVLLPYKEGDKTYSLRIELTNFLKNTEKNIIRDFSSLRLTGLDQELSHLTGFLLAMREAGRQRGTIPEYLKKRINETVHGVFNTSGFDAQVHVYGFGSKED